MPPTDLLSGDPWPAAPAAGRGNGAVPSGVRTSRRRVDAVATGTAPARSARRARQHRAEPARRRRRVAAGLLAMALLCANLLFSLHPYDLTAHAGGDTCELCVAASGLGHAVSGTAGFALPDRDRFATGASSATLSDAAPAAVYHARAPPYRHFA